MDLAKVLEGVEWQCDRRDAIARSGVSGLEYDSRRVEPGFLFFAFEGKQSDGRRFAPGAMQKGAIATVAESGPPVGFTGHWIRTPHLRRALALASRNFYGKLDERLHLTGITGTNGKTTTSYLIDHILRIAGKTTALIGTIEYRIAGDVLHAVNTTPESLDVHRVMQKLCRAGGTHLTMEVSSHGLALGRIYGMRFHTAVFTNLTRDHLDFHQTMEAYFAAKRQLFEGAGGPAPEAAVLNADDAWSKQLPLPRGGQVWWYGLGEEATLRATSISSTLEGLRFEAEFNGKKRSVESGLAGRVNVYNILAAYGAGLSYGLEPDVIEAGIRACSAVPGRFERVDEGQPFGVFVDYAHTDDALRNTIGTARSLSRGRVITVFGCGGDRDREKRPLMGQAAGRLSDFVVLTSDNPRSEDPLQIINDALVGLRRQDVKHLVEPDRTTAIRKAIAEASAGDIVVIAGKGHETYQVLKEGRIDFDDRETSRRILRAFGYGKQGTRG
jgi:UDP-N-acetylmuramoyl-L-alanyl-D-glutamate--2,6-diaminopimelate ligase